MRVENSEVKSDYMNLIITAARKRLWKQVKIKFRKKSLVPRPKPNHVLRQTTERLIHPPDAINEEQ